MKIMRQACFACTTPYQMLGAINITRSQGLDADLYLFGMFNGYEEVAQRLRESGVFANVYAISNHKFRLPEGKKTTYLIAAWQMLFAERYVAAFLPKDVAYETYYSTSRAHGKTLLQSVLKKRNPNLREVLYEDGSGSYVKTSHIFVPSKGKRKLERLLGWKLFDPATTEIMVNLPELMEMPDGYVGCKLSCMPEFPWDQEFRNLLTTVFGATKETEIPQRVIIFDTLRGLNSANSQEKLDLCYEAVVQVFEDKDVICKPHPRSIEKPKADVAVYPHSGIPMEVLYMGMDDLEDRVLVCWNSTAAFTPKMLFRKEPHIIFLDYLVEAAPAAGLYAQCMRVYEKKERVFAPKTIEQLNDVLRKLT